MAHENKKEKNTLKNANEAFNGKRLMISCTQNRKSEKKLM